MAPDRKFIWEKEEKFKETATYDVVLGTDLAVDFCLHSKVIWWRKKKNDNVFRKSLAFALTTLPQRFEIQMMNLN